MGLNQSITVRLLADTSNYTAGMAKVGAETERVSTTMESSGGKTKLLTAGIAAAGVAATALAGIAVNMAADFDASMSTVQANTGASADEMDALRTAAIEAGASTVYAATDAADAINELGKAGMTTEDILSGGLTGALNLAASDGMEVAEAAELMSSAMAQFNLTGADASKIADALAAGAGKAQGSAHDLGYALSQAGMVANSYGISMEETTGTLTAFANAGMIGSDAGTSLKTMLIALANPSDKAATLMDELGVSAFDAQGNFIGLGNLAGVLKERMSGLTQEQRNQALATIFGSDAIRAANVLFKEGKEGIDGWTEAVSDSGYAAEQAAAKNDNLKGDLENLSGSFESLMISIGEAGQGPMRELVQTLDTLIDGFSQLPVPVQQAVVLFTAVTGGSVALHQALGPLTSSTGKFAQTLSLIIDPGTRAINMFNAFRSAGTMFGATFGTAERQVQVFGTTVTKQQGVLAGFKSIGSGLISLLGGPWGIALGIAGAAVMMFAKKAQEAKARTEEFQSAIETTGDASEKIIDELSNAKIDNSWLIPDNLEQAYYGYEKLADLLDDVGIKMSDMALAAQGNADAMNHVTEVTDGMVAAGGKQRDLAGIILSYLNEEKDAYNQASEAAKAKTTAMDEVNAVTGENTSLMEENAATSQGAADAEEILADSFGATKDAASETADALSEVIDALNTFYGFALDASNASIAMKDAFAEATSTIAENGKGLDLNTEKGRKNQSALNDVAEAAQKAMLAHAKNGDTLDEIIPIVDEARNQFVQLAQKAGMSGEEAEKAADKYGLNADTLKKLIDQADVATDANDDLSGSFGSTAQQAQLSKASVNDFGTAVLQLPRSHSTTINVNGVDSALAKVRELGGQINALKSKSITISQSLELSGWVKPNALSQYGPGLGSYTGGLYTGQGVAMRGYARGGIVQGLMPGRVTGFQDDNILLENARVQSGEFVSSTKSVDFYGADTYAAMNRRQIPREVFQKVPERIVVQDQRKQMAQPSLTAEQVQEAMLGALSKLPTVKVFQTGEEAAIAFAKPFSREISRLADRGVR